MVTSIILGIDDPQTPNIISFRDHNKGIMGSVASIEVKLLISLV